MRASVARSGKTARDPNAGNMMVEPVEGILGDVILIRRTADALQTVTGVRPRFYRSGRYVRTVRIADNEEYEAYS